MSFSHFTLKRLQNFKAFKPVSVAILMKICGKFYCSQVTRTFCYWIWNDASSISCWKSDKYLLKFFVVYSVFKSLSEFSVAIRSFLYNFLAIIRTYGDNTLCWKTYRILLNCQHIAVYWKNCGKLKEVCWLNQIKFVDWI